jgi:hypothetical protein
MTRVQQERLNELSRAYTDAVASIVNDYPEPEPVEMMARLNPTECEGPHEAGLIQARPAIVQNPGSNKANYQPEIRQVNNGFIVQLGCQSFVFETFDKMFKYLKMYFEDPNGTETKFHKNELF